MAKASNAKSMGTYKELLDKQNELQNGALVYVHKPESNRIYHVAMVIEDEKGEKYLAESDQTVGGFTINRLADKLKIYSGGLAKFSVGYFPRKK
jgi:hypothetical protein